MLGFHWLDLRRFVGVLITTAPLLTGCSSDSTSGSPPPLAVATVTLDPPSVSVTVGHTQTIAATLRAASGTILSNRTVTWSTSNATIATVSSAGVVTGVSAGGPVTLTATSEGISGTAQVTVVLPPGPVPVELRDTWHATLFGDDDPTVMVIAESGYSVTRPGESTTTASLESTGPSTVRASGNPGCPGTGSYTWIVSGNVLTFISVDQDGCARRTEILAGQPWTRGN